jgi:hypothetical protein
MVQPHFGLYADGEEVDSWEVPERTLTGREAGSVIETVVRAIREYLESHRTVRAVVVRIWGRRSRAKLYRRLAHRLRKEMGWKASVEGEDPTLRDDLIVVASTKRSAKKGLDEILRRRAR